MFRYFEQLWFKNYGDDMQIKGFKNMAKIYVTSSKSTGKVPNDKNKFQDFLMSIMFHTP